MSANSIWKATIHNYLRSLNANLAQTYMQSVGPLDIKLGLSKSDAIEAVFRLCQKKRQLDLNATDTSRAIVPQKKAKVETKCSSSSSDSSEESDSSVDINVHQQNSSKLGASAPKLNNTPSNAALRQPSSAAAAASQQTSRTIPSASPSLTKRPANFIRAKISSTSSESESDSDYKAQAVKPQPAVKPIAVTNVVAKPSASLPTGNALGKKTVSNAQTTSSSSSSSDTDAEITPLKKPTAVAKAPQRTPVTQPAKKIAGPSPSRQQFTLTISSDSSDDSAPGKQNAVAPAKSVALVKRSPVKITTKGITSAKSKLPTLATLELESDTDSDSTVSDLILVNTTKTVGKQKPIQATKVVKQPVSKKAQKASRSDSDSSSSSSSDEDPVLKPMAARLEPPPVKSIAKSAAVPKPKPKSCPPIEVSSSTDSDSSDDSEPKRLKKGSGKLPTIVLTPKSTQEAKNREKASRNDVGSRVQNSQTKSRDGFKCYLCGEEGHSAFACTNSTGSDRGNGRERNFAAQGSVGPNSTIPKHNKKVKFSDD